MVVDELHIKRGHFALEGFRFFSLDWFCFIAEQVTTWNSCRFLTSLDSLKQSSYAVVRFLISH